MWFLCLVFGFARTSYSVQEGSGEDIPFGLDMKGDSSNDVIKTVRDTILQFFRGTIRSSPEDSSEYIS